MNRVLTALVLGASTGAALVTAPALAAESRVTTALCHEASVPCSIQVPSSWLAGTSQQVAVTGNPGVSVRLQAHRVIPRHDGVELDPLGTPRDVRTDRKGFASTDMTLPDLPDGTAGGPVLITTADTSSRDLSEVLGAWTSLRARTPVVAGDGFADRKPVGVDLDLRLTAVPTGARYDVEYRTDGGWRSTGRTRANSPCPGSGVCSVAYVVPRGLSAGRHDFRLVNLASGTAVHGWAVVPDGTGKARPRARDPRVTAVGSAVEGAASQGTGVVGAAVPQKRAENLTLPKGARLASSPEAATTDRHSVTAVRTGALALTVLALVTVLFLRRRHA